MVRAMEETDSARTPGSFLGYQYPEWLFMLLVMFLPLVAAVLRHLFLGHRERAIAVLGWALLYMIPGFVLWLLLMLIIFKLYERKEKKRRS
jgi:hypothetical protein